MYSLAVTLFNLQLCNQEAESCGVMLFFRWHIETETPRCNNLWSLAIVKTQAFELNQAWSDFDMTCSAEHEIRMWHLW